MDLSLKDKVVVVTGGSDGLGLASAQSVARAGGRVAIVGRSPDRLQEAAGTFEDPQSVLTIAADVTEAGALEAVFDSAVDRWGRIDGLVNGAGVHTSGAFVDIEDDVWREDFELKLLATIRGIRLALPHLRETRGSVVTILSVWAKYQDAFTMPSSVYRAAGLALTNGVSKEVAPDGVRVNAVLIGEVKSGQSRRMAERLGLTAQQLQDQRVDALGIPLGRVGEAEEVADTVAFLLSPRAGYITGVGINIDGGFSPLP